MQAVIDRPRATCSDGANVPPVPPVRTGSAGNFDPNDPFYAVVRSYYSAPAPCEHPADCGHAADLVATYHGCGQHLLCEAHFTDWLWEMRKIFDRRRPNAVADPVVCPQCRQPFSGLNDIVTWWRL